MLFLKRIELNESQRIQSLRFIMFCIKLMVMRACANQIIDQKAGCDLRQIKVEMLRGWTDGINALAAR